MEKVWELVIHHTVISGRGFLAYWCFKSKDQYIVKGPLYGLLKPSAKKTTAVKEKAHFWYDPGEAYAWAHKAGLKVAGR